MTRDGTTSVGHPAARRGKGRHRHRAATSGSEPGATVVRRDIHEGKV
ncbi:hypothetical protein [Kitasatospora arboriphila]